MALGYCYLSFVLDLSTFTKQLYIFILIGSLCGTANVFQFFRRELNQGTYGLNALGDRASIRVTLESAAEVEEREV